MTNINHERLGDHYQVFCSLVKELEPCVADIVCNGKTNTKLIGEKLRLLSVCVDEMLCSVQEPLFLYSNVPGEESTRDMYEQYKEEEL